MKRILCAVNSLFQLIVIMQLRKTVFLEDEMDLVISDRLPDSLNIADRFLEEHIFNHVFTIKTQEITYPTSMLKKSFIYFIGNTVPFVFHYLFKNIPQNYDFFLYHNDTLDMQMLWEYVSKNKHMECIRFEEGYSMYIQLGNLYTKGNRFRNFIGKKNLQDITAFAFLFDEELLQVKLKYATKTILPISKGDYKLAEACNKVFAYQPTDFYSQKYIFFEEAFERDGEFIDDIGLVEKIADIVGKENLIIKKHPRTQKDRFRKKGYIVADNISVPWEVMQLNQSLENRVLLTISSGSVLASQLYFNEKVKTFLLYHCVERSTKLTTDYERYLACVQKKHGKTICIPACLEEFLKQLKEENERSVEIKE